MSEKLNIAMIFGNVRRPRIIGGPPPIQVTGKVLTFSLWNLSGGFYEYSLYDSNITANSIVEVVPSRYDIAHVQAAKIMPEADVTAGYVKLYCKNAPAADIDITINIHTGLSTTPAKGFFIASGADGEDGITPHIGANGNWWIGEADTGVKAEGTDGEPGTPGVDGQDGADGTSTYTYVAYASDNSGTGFSLTPTDSLKYRAEIHVTEELDPPAESDFSGATWVKYIGDDGEDGGGGGGSDAPELHLDFAEAGDEFVYNVPYNMKFTSMVSEGTDATLDVALNTVMARYDRLTITATASGLVSLYGVYV